MVFAPSSSYSSESSISPTSTINAKTFENSRYGTNPKDHRRRIINDYDDYDDYDDYNVGVGYRHRRENSNGGGQHGNRGTETTTTTPATVPSTTRRLSSKYRNSGVVEKPFERKEMTVGVKDPFDCTTSGTETTSQSILLQRSENRLKRVEFELDVSKDVASGLRNQLRDAQREIQELKQTLNGNGTIALGEKGMKELLQISQSKLRQSEKNGAFTEERIAHMAKELRSYKRRVQECELERALHLEKIDECLTMLAAQAGNDAKQQELQEKVFTVCDLKRDIKSLENQLTEKDSTIQELKDNSQLSKAMVTELTRLLSPELNAKKIDETIAALQKGRELTTEQAQLLTIQHLKSQVESLEDEKSTFVQQIADLSEKLEIASVPNGDVNNNRKLSIGKGFSNLLRTAAANARAEKDEILKKYNDKRINRQIEKKLGV